MATYKVVASELSALCGRNKFQNSELILKKIYDTPVYYHSDTWMESIRSTINSLSRNICIYFRSLREDVRVGTVFIRGNSPAHCETNPKDILKRGKIHESSVIASIQEKLKIKINPPEKIYRKTFTIKRGYYLQISGVIDGYISDKNNIQAIIEIKTRTRNIFGMNRLLEENYDLDQLATYAYLYEFLPSEYKLCEAFEDDIAIHTFSRKEMRERWKELKRASTNNMRRILRV